MVSLSCEVDPAFREYERTVVTAFDAYIKPVIDALSRAPGARACGEAAIAGAAADHAVARRGQRRRDRAAAAGAPVPVGPGGGRDRRARWSVVPPALDDLITVDIGGTSCDIALVRQGKPLIRPEGLVDGYPIRVPMVDVNAIGAGGGSIAWLDGAGGLRVGPHSAGSEPGPACYGRGGDEATVTDASVVLGYIDPGYFAGGSLKLDPELAREPRSSGGSPARSASASSRRRSASIAWSTRRWPRASGWSRSGRAFDPREFALVPSAARGRCTRPRSPASSASRTILVPRHPGRALGRGLAGGADRARGGRPRSRTPLDGLSGEAVRAALAELDAGAAPL